MYSVHYILLTVLNNTLLSFFVFPKIYPQLLLFVYFKSKQNAVACTQYRLYLSPQSIIGWLGLGLPYSFRRPFCFVGDECSTVSVVS